MFIAARTPITIQNQSARTNYGNLFDIDTETCIDSEMALKDSAYYLVDLVIPQKRENGLVTVYFNQTVECDGRQVT